MTTRILGIDPGSRFTGLAVLERRNREFEALFCDVIRLTDTSDPFDRLRILYAETGSLIETYRPDSCAIETPVYGKDPSAMLKLGRAQAALMMAVLHSEIPLFEYYPKAVKKAVSGSGNARKGQVAFMLRKLVRLPEADLPDDATDALAVAWCHFQKLADPVSDPETDRPSRQRKNTWSSFVINNPGRVRR